MADLSLHRPYAPTSAVDTYVAALATAILCIAYLDLANYLHVLSQQAILPKHIYFMLAGLMAPLWLLRLPRLQRYLKTPYVAWTAAMVVMNLFHWAMLNGYGDAEAASLTLTRIQYLVLAAMLGFVLLQSSPALLGQTCVALALVLTGLQLFDFLAPGTLLPQGTPGTTAGRAGSTLINANKAPESLLLLTLVGMSALRPHKRLLLLLAVLPGVLVSFSRAGMLVWFFIFATGFWLRLFPRKAALTYTITLSFAVLLLGGWLFENLTHTVDNRAIDDITARLFFFSTLNTGDDSAQERLAVALHALEAFSDQIIFGNGAGFTAFWSDFEVSTHNQHILILAEYGLIGYLFFIWLFILIWKGGEPIKSTGARNLIKILFFSTLLFTLFTHNMFDNLYWLVTFAVLGQRAQLHRPLPLAPVRYA